MLFKYYILFSINFSFIAFGLQFGFHGISRSVPRLYSSEETSIKDQWFEQRVDHFDPQDNRTFKQLYYINDTFYDKKDGPIFLIILGEQVADPMFFNGIQMTANYAKRFKAMSVLLEHRFYGKSRPFDDYSSDNLRYLTSQQALQDTAFFIEYLNDKMSLNGKQWIVFGGSYAGALAAWFQAKYPHLSSGAVASSAPVRAQVNFKEYMGAVIKGLGESCSHSIRNASIEMAEKIKTKKGCEEIGKKFELCAPLDGTDKDAVNHLMWVLSSLVMNSVQYDTKGKGYSESNDTAFHYPTIDDVCDIMNNNTDIDSAFDRYSKVSQMYGKVLGRKCVDFDYKAFINAMSRTAWNETYALIYRQWYYQTCDEFGWYMTTDNEESPFLDYLSVSYYIKRCTDIYGPKFTQDFVEKSIDFTNNYYGGDDIKVRKVIFPNGATDPISVLSFHADPKEDVTVLTINGTGHCADMLADSDDDIPAMIDARKVIADTIEEFLKKP